MTFAASGEGSSAFRVPPSVSEKFRHCEYGPDDCDDVDDERAEDQSEHTVQDIPFHRFDLRLQAQLALPQFAAQIRDFGLQLGPKLLQLGANRGNFRLQVGAKVADVDLG
jgi:hypothetical protein